MRLTLRTMLAYLDETLSPEDAKDIAQRIEGSEYASNVVHRMRDVGRRLRLGAPPLSGRAGGIDANVVSEYLDSTLSPDRMPDFERLCLESEMHLAEVAACHQILARLEPVAAEPGMRERMYKLIEQAEAPRKPKKVAARAAEEQPATPVVAAVPVSTAAPEESAPRPVEVPDYLREGRRRWRFSHVAAALLLGGLLVLAVLMAIPQPDGKGWFAWYSGDTAPLPAPGPATVDPMTADDETPADTPAADATEAADPTDDAAEEPASDTAGETAAGDADAAAAGTEALVVPDEGTQPDRAAAEGDVAEGDAAEMDDASIPDADDAETVAGDADDDEAAPLPEDAVVEDPADIGDADVAVESAGRYVSQDAVLLRLDAANEWKRLVPNAVLSIGDRLLSLPAFRSTLTLSGGVQVQLIGEAEIELLSVDEAGVPGLRVAYGRVSLVNVGRAQNKLRMETAAASGVLLFDDAESTAALEVQPIRVAASDPEQTPPLYASDLFATSGTLSWDQEGDKAPVTVEAPAREVLGSVPGNGSADPAWLASAISAVDQKAAETVESHFSLSKRSAILSLNELAEHRRAEVRALAVRGLAGMGDYVAILASLNALQERNAWNGHCQYLQQVVSRSAEHAGALRKAIETQRPPHAAELYRLLWGYTSDGLKGGDAAKLVKQLDHAELDVRVLAFWNLESITGFGLFYRPEYAETRRDPFVQKWRQKLENGQVVFKPAEAVAPPRRRTRPKVEPDEPAPPPAEDESTEEGDAAPRPEDVEAASGE